MIITFIITKEQNALRHAFGLGRRSDSGGDDGNNDDVRVPERRQNCKIKLRGRSCTFLSLCVGKMR